MPTFIEGSPMPEGGPLVRCPFEQARRGSQSPVPALWGGAHGETTARASNECQSTPIYPTPEETGDRRLRRRAGRTLMMSPARNDAFIRR